MYSLGQQISELAVSLGLGMLVALMLQVYQSALFRLKIARWYAWSCDLLFWLLAVGLVFGGLLAVNGGEVRVHILLSLLAGAVIFRLYWYRRTQRLVRVLAIPVAFVLGGTYLVLTWPRRVAQRLKQLRSRRSQDEDEPPDDDSDDGE